MLRFVVPVEVGPLGRDVAAAGTGEPRKVQCVAKMTKSKIAPRLYQIYTKTAEKKVPKIVPVLPEPIVVVAAAFTVAAAGALLVAAAVVAGLFSVDNDSIVAVAADVIAAVSSSPGVVVAPLCQGMLLLDVFPVVPVSGKGQVAALAVAGLVDHGL